MQCTRCRREVRVGSSFCPHCGEPAAQAYDPAPQRAHDTGDERPYEQAPPAEDPYDSQLTTEIPIGPPPSPFSRDAVQPPVEREQPAPQQPPRPAPRSAPPTTPVVGGPPAPPPPVEPAWEGFSTDQGPGPQVPARAPAPPSRTFAEVMAGFSTGLLGGVVVGAFAVQQALAGLVTALNGDAFSKTAFLLLDLLVVAVTVVATVAIWGRTRTSGRAPDALETLSLGAGLFASTYGVLVLLTAALSDQGQALQLVR